MLKNSSQDDNSLQRPLISRIYEWTEKTIFQSFSLLAYHASVHYSVLLVQCIIGTLQYVHFLSDDYLPFKWHSSVAKVFMTVARAVSRFPVPSSSLIAFWISVSLTWIWLSVAVLAILMHRMNGWTWPLSCLRQCLIWLPSVFLIPVIRHLFEMSFGCAAYTVPMHQLHPFYSGLVCWSGIHVGYTILAICTSTIFLLASIVTTYCFYDTTLPSKINTSLSDSSRTTNTHELVDMAGKTVLLLLFSAGRTSQWTYALPFIFCIFPAFLLVFHIRHVPLYQDRAELVYVARAAVTLWTGLCGIALVFLHDSEAQGMLYFVGIPLLLAGSQLGIRARYNYALHLAEHELIEPHLVMLVAQATIRSFYRRLWSLGDVYVDESPELLEAHALMVSRLERVIFFGTSRFPDNVPVRLLSAFFQAQVKQNRVLAYTELQAAEAGNADFGQRYFFFVSRLHLDLMASLANSTDVQTYMRFKEGKDRADGEMAAATRYLIHFWTLLLSENPDVDELAVLGHSARTMLGRSVAGYEELLRLNYRSIPVLRTFGVVLLDVTGDTPRALAMFQAAERVEMEHLARTQESLQRDFMQQLDTNLDIHDDRNAIFSISVDRQSMGVIESANLAALHMFGYSTEGSMKNRNINIIMPQPVARHHDQYIIDYIARKASRNVGRTRLMFAVHALGYLIPVHVYVRWADEAKGKFVGVLRALTGGVHEADVTAIMNPATKTLTYTTSNFYKFFGISRRSVMAQEVQLYEVLSALTETDRADEYYERMMRKEGWMTEVVNQLTGRKLRVHVVAVRQRVYDEDAVYVRMNVEELATEKSPDSDSEPEFIAQPQSLVDRFASVLDGVRVAEVANTNCPLPQLSFPDGEDSLLLDTAHEEVGLLPTMASPLVTPLPVPAVGARTVEDMVTEADDDEALRSVRARTHLQRQRDNIEKLSGRSAVADEDLVDSVEGVRSRAVETSAHARENFLRARKPRAHLRLLRAIRNESQATTRRIRVMAGFAAAMSLFILVVAIVVYFVSLDFLSESSSLMSATSMSTSRAYYILDAALHMRSYMLLLNAPWLASFYYRENVFADNSYTSVLDGLRSRAQLMLAMNHGVTDTVREIGYRTDRQRALDVTASIPTSILVRSKPFPFPMSLRESVQTFNAEGYALLGTSSMLSKISSHYFIVANALTSVRTAVYEYGEEIRKGIEANHQSMLLVLILLTMLCLSGMGALLLVFIMPAIVHVERSKHRVLDVLLDIPPPVRRRIRRKLLGVMHVVRSSQENVEEDHDIRQVEIDDEFADQGEKERQEREGERDKVFDRYFHRTTKDSTRLGQQSTAEFSSDSDSDAQTLSRSVLTDLNKLRDDIHKDTTRFDGTSRTGTGMSRGSGVGVSSRHFMHKYDRSRVEISPEHMSQYMTGRTRETDKFSVVHNRTLRVVLAKYLFCAVIVGVYFAVMFSQTMAYSTLIEQSSVALDLATRRLPAILFAFFAAREHAFFDFDGQTAAYPDDPVLRIGRFEEAVYNGIVEARELHFAVVFGESDLKPPKHSDRQRSVLFANSCAVQPHELTKMGIFVGSFFWEHCETVESGLLSHGMYAALIDVAESVFTFLDPLYSGVLHHRLQGPSVQPPAGREAAAAWAFDRLRQLDTLLSDYLSPIIQFSTSEFFNASLDELANAKRVYLVILIAFLCGVLAAYLVVVRPIGSLLQTTATRSQAILMLLPPSIVKTMPSLQEYIQDNILKHE